MLLLGVWNDEGVPTVHIKQLISKKVQPCIGRFCSLLCTDLVLGGSWSRELSSGVRVECVCVGFQLVCLDKGKCCDNRFLFRLPGSCFPTISKHFLCLTHSSQTFSLTLAFLCHIFFLFISTYFLELSIGFKLSDPQFESQISHPDSVSSVYDVHNETLGGGHASLQLDLLDPKLIRLPFLTNRGRCLPSSP